MIPVKLSVRNFMPYRDNVPPLYFNGIHTACISGDNGNGKSALIDAMTWALWGKTRAKSDDELIHQGQGEMEVEFDFTVGEQGYRIIRKHAKAKRRGGAGKSLLDFQIAANGGFKSISADSISQTQQKIINVLHMDYAILGHQQGFEETLRPNLNILGAETPTIINRFRQNVPQNASTPSLYVD